MEALANTLERLALESTTDEKVFSETIKGEYQYLFELANDAYLAALDTHLASLNYSELDASGTIHGA